MKGPHRQYTTELLNLRREIDTELARARIGQTPGDEFTKALGRVVVERQIVLDRDPRFCAHTYWNIERGGRTTCRSCGVDTTDMEAMGG